MGRYRERVANVKWIKVFKVPHMDMCTNEPAHSFKMHWSVFRPNVSFSSRAIVWLPHTWSVVMPRWTNAEHRFVVPISLSASLTRPVFCALRWKFLGLHCCLTHSSGLENISESVKMPAVGQMDSGAECLGLFIRSANRHR